MNRLKAEYFEEYLMCKCMEEVPATDDMYPDIYEDWIVEQDIDDIIAWANEWKENELSKHVEEQIKDFCEYLLRKNDGRLLRVIHNMHYTDLMKKADEYLSSNEKEVLKEEK